MLTVEEMRDRGFTQAEIDRYHKPKPKKSKKTNKGRK